MSDGHKLDSGGWLQDSYDAQAHIARARLYMDAVSLNLIPTMAQQILVVVVVV